ncbi:triose-phosphate isomerase [Sulfuriferula sp. GW1]|uniref:triose-phosphate isomerase n=1 Tax=Sulfuriferula sp. GW1 TaxID=3345111 RepID=UPI0039AFF3ED
MRKKLVAGNWKMHGSLAENKVLLEALVLELGQASTAGCIVCAPFPYLAQVQSVLSGSTLAWGAQNVSNHAKGAYTGEVSASMLLDFGCSYVIIGHSERRALYGEDDASVAAKFAAAQAAGLIPILCVGETLEEREAGVTEAVIGRQLDAVLAVSGIEGIGRAVVAYEPVWAIGTGKTASPQQAQAMHAFIRAKLAVLDKDVAASLVIQYGGSVKAANAAELFAQPDIDGGLIGGASLVADEFIAICRAAQG